MPMKYLITLINPLHDKIKLSKPTKVLEAAHFQTLSEIPQLPVVQGVMM